MKYLATFVIGIGLMVHSPASAEKLKFNKGDIAPMEECIEASKVGYEVANFVSVDGDASSKRYLVRGLKMGVLWRVYTITYVRQQAGGFLINCHYRTGEKY